jgi:CheY-like chemotaxis protein
MMALIVFCEDDPTIQKLIRVALRTTPHEILLASDGDEGFALIEQMRPDLIFTDVSMPGLNGLQLCDAVKARPDLAQIPIIFVTASVQRSEIEEGYRHGVLDYLVKPFSPADLRAKIAALVATEH